MKFFEQSKLPHYQFDILNNSPQIKHYVATRHGGVSQGEFASLNISFGTADKRENIIENRHRIADFLDIPDQHLVFPSQTHGVQVQRISMQEIQQGNNWLTEHLQCTDALMTNEKGICISVISADCVPILMYDPINQAIAAVHSGWRGTVKKIVQKTVLAMKEAFGTQATDLLIGIGPSIGPEKYEVGPEVITEVVQAFGTKKGFVHREMPNGKGFLDLWALNIHQLTAIGVQTQQIECAKLCTLTMADTFFSARSYQGKGGRFGSGLMLCN